MVRHMRLPWGQNAEKSIVVEKGVEEAEKAEILGEVEICVLFVSKHQCKA